MEVVQITCDRDDVLGTGMFGKGVSGVMEESQVAIKLLNRTTKICDVKREVNLLRACRHPHVCRILAVCRVDGEVGIVTEMLERELFGLVEDYGSIPEVTAARLLYGIAGALAFMHDIGVTHCDIKLENILVVGERAKIIDFGLANTGCVGTISYAAPEVMLQTSKAPVVHPARDAWAYGVVLFSCLLGFFPFKIAHASDWRFRSASTPSGADTCHQLFLLYWCECVVSNQAVQLIDSLLAVAVSNRSTMAQVCAHEWFLVGFGQANDTAQ